MHHGRGRVQLGWVLLGSLLLLPPPGTESRARNFCRAWLAATTPERQQVLIAAEQAEAGGGLDRSCREGLRGGLRHTLDAECSNWSKLMDFEVRQLVDRKLVPCRATTGG